MKAIRTGSRGQRSNEDDGSDAENQRTNPGAQNMGTNHPVALSALFRSPQTLEAHWEMAPLIKPRHGR